MTIDQILAMDDRQLMKLSKSEQKKVATTLFSAANKRVKRLEELKEKEDIKNIASLDALQKSGGLHFSTKNKNYNQLRNELFRARKLWAVYKTGSVKAYKESKKEWEAAVSPERRLSTDQWNKINGIMNKMDEMHPALLKQHYRAMQDFIIDNQNLSEDQLLAKAEQEIQRLESESMESWQGVRENSVSQFFDIVESEED